MKIQYVSDIHLEFYSKLPKITPVADVLVLAGDIGYPTSKIYVQFLKEMNTLFKKVFLITGNHEYYADKHIEDIDTQIQQIINSNDLKNISFLNCSYEDYEGYRFVGATLWSHIDNPSYTINDTTQIKDFSVEFIGMMELFFYSLR
jgi:predicted MPP superfamily phosphohydrolase